MEAFTIKHDEELERAYGKWVLVRRSLDVSTFGLNAVELPPGESIPEHDETGRGHEEVFLVLEGERDDRRRRRRPPPPCRLVRAPRAGAEAHGAKRQLVAGARADHLRTCRQRLRAAGLGIGRDPRPPPSSRSAAAAVALALVVGGRAAAPASRRSPGAASGEPLSVTSSAGSASTATGRSTCTTKSSTRRPGGSSSMSVASGSTRSAHRPPTGWSPAWERSAAVCPLLSEPGVGAARQGRRRGRGRPRAPLLHRQRGAGSRRIGRRDRSRADLRLSASHRRQSRLRAGSALLERRRTGAGSSARTTPGAVDSEDPDELYGWQDSDTDRIHMRLDQCNLLHRLGARTCSAGSATIRSRRRTHLPRSRTRSSMCSCPTRTRIRSSVPRPRS